MPCKFAVRVSTESVDCDSLIGGGNKGVVRETPFPSNPTWHASSSVAPRPPTALGSGCGTAAANEPVSGADAAEFTETEDEVALAMGSEDAVEAILDIFGAADFFGFALEDTGTSVDLAVTFAEATSGAIG